MKRIGQIVICIIMAAAFCYLMFFDYPATIKRLTPEKSDNEEAISSAEASLPETESDRDIAETSVAEESTETEEQTVDVDELKAQIPDTQTLLFAGSIRTRVYDEIYPVFEDADAVGTMLFFKQHLTGDYDQLLTPTFLELVDDGWGYSIGGVEDDLTDDEWKSSLTENVNRVLRRAGISPSVYFFRAGEYQPEREEILEKEDFTAFYYAEEDADAVQDGTTDLKRICWVSFADLDEDEISDLLDQAWSYDSVAFSLEIDEDSGSTADQWDSLLSALRSDDRFTVMSQSDWLESEQESTEDRAKMVASVLKAEKE